MKKVKDLQKFKTVNSKIVYQNQWIKLQEDQVIRPDGKKGVYAYVVTPPAVLIIALSENNEIYLVKQQRYPLDSIETLEVPAGNTDGQDSLKAAKRELREETGLEAKDWQHLGETQPFNAISNETNHTYLATGLTQTGANKQTEDGISEASAVAFADAINMIHSGQITDGQSITAIIKAGLYLGLLKMSTK